VARDGLEPVAGEVARGEVVAAHGVERVDELAARRDVAGRIALARRGARRLSEPSRAAERERDAERPSRARARKGRSKPWRLWFSITSGSAARIEGHERG
jgi:hypothetical protein